MGFQYPLQKVVDLKANQRTQAEWGLSKAIGQFEQQQQTIQLLQQQITEAEQAMDTAVKKSSAISYIQMLQQHLDFLQQQIEYQRKKLIKAEQKVEKSKQVLTHKMQDEKVWETAKENALVNFMKLQQKKEQSELDELATARYIRT